MLTHSDIKTKFLIEYDKANITSSYPSLTDYEIANILDKAYYAIIAQKVTGNNPRQAAFESDNKAIADIQPLIVTEKIEEYTTKMYVENDIVYPIPEDMLYFIQAKIDISLKQPYNNTYSSINVMQVTHDIATKYMCTINNKPWVPTPVCYMESGNIIVLVDPECTPDNIFVTYVKKPQSFVSNMFDSSNIAYFELSESMAEELINLAIIFATETVESPRLTTKVNIRPLES